ncbi:MAG: hypothetical protein SFW36_19130, partial [Leptolyngbyaceae cyanobacterium bins.59]|nr:hypothetical protein [Leptolyngbyaceae cyanobacterium bins.59]
MTSKIRKSKGIFLLKHLLIGGTIVLAMQLSAQAFNFTTGEVGGSCQELLTSFNPYTPLGSQKLASCRTADEFYLFARGGDLQAKQNYENTSVGVTDFDWSGSSGFCIVGIISPCNGNTGEAEIGYQEALYLELPKNRNLLKSLNLSFHFG